MTPLVLATHAALTGELPRKYDGAKSVALAGAPPNASFARLGQLLATRHTGAVVLRLEIGDNSGWVLYVGPLPREEAAGKIRDFREKLKEMKHPRYPALTAIPVAMATGPTVFGWYREASLPVAGVRVGNVWKIRSALKAPMDWLGNEL